MVNPFVLYDELAMTELTKENSGDYRRKVFLSCASTLNSTKLSNSYTAFVYIKMFEGTRRVKQFDTMYKSGHKLAHCPYYAS